MAKWEWRTNHRRYLIHPDTLLLLPDGDEYSLTIDSYGTDPRFLRGIPERSG